MLPATPPGVTGHSCRPAMVNAFKLLFCFWFGVFVGVYVYCWFSVDDHHRRTVLPGCLLNKLALKWDKPEKKNCTRRAMIRCVRWAVKNLILHRNFTVAILKIHFFGQFWNTISTIFSDRFLNQIWASNGSLFKIRHTKKNNKISKCREFWKKRITWKTTIF